MNGKFLGKQRLVYQILIVLISIITFLSTAEAKTKVDSLLSLQLKNKTKYISDKEFNTKNKTMPLYFNNEGNSQEAIKQKLFLHFVSNPSTSQLKELEELGTTVYRDSWLPAQGDSVGFMLAEVPVEMVAELADKDYLVRITSAEQTARPHNDLAAVKINSEVVKNTLNVDGNGIKIAVLDSGLDLGHPDFAYPLYKNDYSRYPYLDDDITDYVSGHGTHVTGSVVGRGVQSEGKYRGMAPGAELIFLKVGNDTTGEASSTAIVNAIKDARSIYGADIITMSYGGWSVYHDGTDEMSQAVDWAVAQGAAVFIAAANEGSSSRHYSGSVPANGLSEFIEVRVKNASPNEATLCFNLVWFDGLGTNADLELEYYDATKNKITDISTGNQSESPRGTESEYSCYNQYVSPGNSTYYLKVINKSSNSQGFHIYEAGNGTVEFANPDPNYTIGSPAEADGAIAIGAYVTRINGENYKGKQWRSIQPELDVLASWSSRGPRVDGVMKPDFVAPGNGIISCRDNNTLPLSDGGYDNYIVDNDGIDLDGSGPADYIVMSGTSMATPIAAGASALLMQAIPDLKGSPELLRTLLANSALDQGSQGPDSEYGYGLIDLARALDISVTEKPEEEIQIPKEEPVVTSVRLSKDTLTIRGTKFIKGVDSSSVVLINTETMEEFRAEDYGQVTVISTSKIEVEYLLLGSGSYRVVVTNPDGGRSRAEKNIKIKDTRTPAISKISPRYKKQGSKPFTLKIYGKNFLPDSLVEYKLNVDEEFKTLPLDITMSGDRKKITIKNCPVFEDKGRYDIRVTNTVNGETFQYIKEKAFEIK